MPIEFRCSSCQALLRVPDSAAGRQAKCPTCGAIAAIPAGGPPPDPPPPDPAAGAFAPGPPPPPPASFNPYQPPREEPAPQLGGGALGSGRLVASEALGTAWRIFQNHLGPAVLATFVLGLIAFVVNGIANAFVGPALHPQAPPAARLVPLVVAPLLALVGTFLDQCRKQFYLRLARGEGVSVGELFQMRAAFWPYFGATVLVGLAYSVAATFCLVPAIFVYLYLGQYGRLLIERRGGAIESFSLSSRVTEGNRSELFLLMLAGLGIGLLGLLACLVGLLFALPLIDLTFAVAYLRMTGQRTAIDG